MHAEHARRLLGVTHDAGADDLRAAYRRELLHHHPDRSAATDATERTIELTGAYRLLVALAEAPAPPADAAPPSGPVPPGGAADPRDSAPSRGAAPREPAPELALELSVELVDDTTIALGAPPDETLFLVSETAHQLGEITYLDPSAGLIEVIVEFIEAPTSSIVFTLQGRATGVTDVFCSVEPLSGGVAPPVDAVTRLVLDTVQTVAVAHRRRPVQPRR